MSIRYYLQGQRARPNPPALPDDLAARIEQRFLHPETPNAAAVQSALVDTQGNLADAWETLEARGVIPARWLSWGVRRFDTSCPVCRGAGHVSNTRPRANSGAQSRCLLCVGRGTLSSCPQCFGAIDHGGVNCLWCRGSRELPQGGALPPTERALTALAVDPARTELAETFAREAMSRVGKEMLPPQWHVPNPENSLGGRFHSMLGPSPRMADWVRTGPRFEIGEDSLRRIEDCLGPTGNGRTALSMLRRVNSLSSFWPNERPNPYIPLLEVWALGFAAVPIPNHDFFPEDAPGAELGGVGLMVISP